MKLERMWEDWKTSWGFMLHVVIILSPFFIVGSLIWLIISWVT